jgi:HAD superfamily hydrolase (TIGR01509 family)
MWRPDAALEALLIDLDGTLADSHPVLRAAFDAFLRSRGIEPTQAAFDTFDGARLVDIVAILRRRHELPEPLEQLTHEYEQGLEQTYGEVGPLAGARELVETARAAGLQLVLVTSAQRALAEAFLARAGLREAFAGIVAGDTGPVKPDPAPYRAALAVAGADPARALAVEDAPAGVASAVAAGIDVVAVSGSPARADALRAAGARRVVADLHELAAALAHRERAG